MLENSIHLSQSEFTRILDLTVLLSEAVLLIVGAYQFYFWCQRRSWRRPMILSVQLDYLIPYNPHWVWIYSGLYYPVIIWLTFTVTTMREFNYVAFSYVLLLGIQMLFFLLLPVATPADWRVARSPKNLSESFLALVQRFDSPSNCLPSMHVSVATLTAFHLTHQEPQLTPAGFLFPILIAASALFTKQHYLLDLPAGFLCGWLVFLLYRELPV